MSRIAFAILFTALLAGCSSSPHTGSDISPATQAAMSSLYVGMTEDEAVVVMKPVTKDSARITYGGTGRGLLYFQVSATKQFWLEVGAGPDFRIERLGKVEAKRKWIRDSRGNVSFE